MCAGFSDIASRPTVFFRTIPTVRIRRGTNDIFRVVFLFRRTIPIVFAVFVRREDLSAIGTDAIAGNVGIRSVVLLSISGTVPVVVAVSIQGKVRCAFFAIPTVCAGNGRHIRLVTGRAEPIVLRTGFAHAVMRFAFRACPVMRAMLRFIQNRIALRTVEMFVRAVGT